MSSNNYSKNFRISQTPKAIRNNQYNPYTDAFSPNPIILNSELNDQRLCTTFNIGKKILNNGFYPPVVRPAKPIVVESISDLTTVITLDEQNNGGLPILSYKVYGALSDQEDITELSIDLQETDNGVVTLYLSVLIQINGSFQVSSVSSYGESPRSDLITIIDKVSVNIPGTPFSYYQDIWQ